MAQAVARYFPGVSNIILHDHAGADIPWQVRLTLGVGLHTIPGPDDADNDTIVADVHAFTNRVRKAWKGIDFMHEEPSHRRRARPAPSQVKPAPPSVEDFLADVYTSVTNALHANPKREGSNIPLPIRQGINWLKKHPEIIVKPCDKNMGTAIVSAAWYTNEVYQGHLLDQTTYAHVGSTTIDGNLPTELTKTFDDIANRLKGLVKDAAKANVIDKDEAAYLSVFDMNLPQFYLTIKVHKVPLKGRPIVPSHSWITTPASAWLSDQLLPICEFYPQYLKDSTQVIRRFETITYPPDVLLMALDIEAMYPNLYISTVMNHVTAALQRHANKHQWSADKQGFIIRLLEFVLSNNYLQFDTEIFRQICGTAMGTPVAVAAATLTMCEMESQHLLEGPDIVLRREIKTYVRFVDDALALITGGERTASRLVHVLNNMDPRIKWTYTLSTTSAVHQDLEVFKGDRFLTTGRLDIKTYQKPLNSYSYLVWQSGHQLHHRTSYITSELQRYIKSCTNEQDFNTMKDLFRSRLLARGVPNAIIDHQFAKACYHQRHDLLWRRTKTTRDTTVPFVTVYTRRTERLRLHKIINAAYQRHEDRQEMSMLFNRPPLLAYKVAKNIGDFVTSARFRKPTEGE